MKILALFLLLVAPAFAATVASDGTQPDVQNKINAATDGDTITMPSGSFTWGSSVSHLSVNKAITLSGAGEGSTIINLAADGPFYNNGVIQITAAATVSGFTINGIINTAGGPSTTPISCAATGWRVHHVTFNGPVAPGYFAYCGGSEGLFDHLTLNTNHGSCQTFQLRGAVGLWNNPHTMGTVHTVYFEDSTFNGVGYICEADGSAQFAMRFCLITGTNQIDLHQIETSVDVTDNTPHGGRQVEVYNNRWSYTPNPYWSAMEIKAGTAMIFDNAADSTPGILLFAYGVQGQFWSTDFSHTQDSADHTKYITPAQIPVQDYIGVGPTTRAQGKEPLYSWNNIQNTTGAYSGKGTNVDWPAVTQEAYIAAGAITQYGSTFAITDIVQPDISFFNGPIGSTFDGSSGIGRGTKAAMNAINMSGKTKKVGFWVTNEGSWRSGFSGTSGQLYQWNGSAWVLYYTPYPYPHPLQAGGATDTTPPTPNPSTISGTPTHTASTISVTETTATDETALAAAPYSFSNDNGGSWTADQISASYTWTGLTASTAYLVKVRAKDAAGNTTTASSATTVTTDAVATSPSIARIRRVGVGF